MSDVIVDARGRTCPMPLIMTRQALKEQALGTRIEVRVDNEISCRNVERYLRDNGMPPELGQAGGVFSLTFVKSTPTLAVTEAEAYCGVEAGARSASLAGVAGGASYVVSLAGDYVGKGSEELGRLLVKGLLETLKEVAPAPTHVVLYSSGILLAVDDSPCVEPLRELERRGVGVLICGTCVEFYRKQAEIHVGTISNMLTILETLTRAGKIIAP